MSALQRQYVAYAGAAALLIGAFTPVVTAPIVGGMTLLTYSSVAGSITVALAICAAFLAFKDQIRALLYVGIAALAVPAYVIGKYEYTLHEIHQELTSKGGLAETIGSAFAGTFQLGWGLVFLIFSAIMVAVAGLPERNAPVAAPLDRRTLMIAGGILLAVALVTTSYNVTQGFLVSGAIVTADDRDALTERVADSYLSDADKGEFSAAMARAETAGYDPNGKTVRDVVADQRAFEVAQAEAKAKAEAAAKELATAIQISAKYEYISQDPNWFETGGAQEDDVKFMIHGRNDAGKAIRAFEGTLTVDNSLGNKLGDVDFQLTPNSDIPAEATFDTSQTVRANWVDVDLTSLKDASPSRIRMIWKTTKVVFADGSTLVAAPDANSSLR